MFACKHPLNLKNTSNMVAEPGASQIVDALIPPVTEEIIDVVRRIPHERIRQCILEETVKDAPEDDQGQSTFDSQPKDIRADTSCTGAVAVSESEQPASERLAVVLVSEAASKNGCAHVTADQEVLAKTSAEELKSSADTTHVLGSETGAVDGHTYPLFQVCSFTGVHPTVDFKEFDVVTMRRLAQKEHCFSSARFPRLSSHEVWSRCCEDPFAQVKESITELITGLINKLHSEPSSETNAGGDPFFRREGPDHGPDHGPDKNKLQPEASSEATHKSYLDDESEKACEKKVDPETQVATHSPKLEADVPKSGEVAELNVDLGAQSAPAGEGGRDAFR